MRSICYLSTIALLTAACGGGDSALTLFRTDNEAPGPNCANGGNRIETGVDDNGNGILDSDEVDNSSYLCNDGTGTGSLVEIDDEPSGENCPLGGKVIRTGDDANGNGVLDDGEVADSSYLCNGGAGTGSLVDIGDEPSGVNCPLGGKVVRTGTDANGNGILDDDEIADVAFVCNGGAGSGSPEGSKGFRLVSRFTDIGVAEIIAVSPDGDWLAYTDSERQMVGFVDIADIGRPTLIKEVDVADSVTNVGEGEPTSVDITPNNRYAVVAVKDTSDPENAADPGALVFIDTETFAVAGSVNIGVGPDSVKVTPDGSRVVVAIEDEEDADKPIADRRPGSVQIVTIDYNAPSSSTVETVAIELTVGNQVTDPQPEFVDVTDDGKKAIVSLQENNALAVLDLTASPVTVERYIDAGTVARDGADVSDDGEIDVFEAPFSGRREPDGVCALSDGTHFVTANEGDTGFDDFGAGVFSGGRGFSIFHVGGDLVYEVGAELEQVAIRFGMYPDGRSDNRGIEVEGCHVSRFVDREFAFVLGERNSSVAVYDVTVPAGAQFIQFLPTPLRPESAASVPERGLLIVAGEGDDGIGGGIWIYRSVVASEDVGSFSPGVLQAISAFQPPAPFGAISSIAFDKTRGQVAAIPDNAFDRQRMWFFEESPTSQRMRLVDEVLLTDVDGVTALSGYDPEGLAFNPEGGFIIASEGEENNGCVTVPSDCPDELRNRILFFDDSGALDPTFGDGGIVDLPVESETNAINWERLSNFGFEGITVVDSNPGATGGLLVYVAFQRPLEATDPDNPEPETALNHARIGEYDVDSDVWQFYFYPLEADLDGVDNGEVFLSEIRSIPGRFLVIERDRQQAGTAQIKRIYGFELATGTAGDPSDPVEKELQIDLLDLAFPFDFEKVEGLDVIADSLLIANDNDGGVIGNFFSKIPFFN